MSPRGLAAVPSVPDVGASEEMRRIVEVCERAAHGDLEARITGVPADPELGRLCHAINHMLDVADAFVREASAAMESCSRERFHRPILLRGLRGAYRKGAAVINTAGLKMKESSAQLSFVAEVAAHNVSSVATVATACEELNVTNSEISRQATESTRLTEQAVGQSRQAVDAVGALADAVRKVDSIVALINKVAGQTNLLALNATIEAARAGEQGKGFAVVATEVKELSRHTAAATGEISSQVEAMRKTASDVESYIAGIGESIEQVDLAALAIARSVEEQVHATGEIGRSIDEVARDATLVSERIGGVKASRS